MRGIEDIIHANHQAGRIVASQAERLKAAEDILKELVHTAFRTLNGDVVITEAVLNRARAALDTTPGSPPSLRVMANQ